MILLILSTFVLLSGVITSLQGQILPQNNNPTATSTGTLSASPTVKNPYGIRITDPTKGEQFLVNGTTYYNNNGQKLSLNGFSVANSGNLTNCDVTIVTNNKFPYQPANGTGPHGKDDFSKWSYTFSSEYANLHEGSNKITSKLTCDSGSAKAYYSVNITGMKFNGTFPKPKVSLNHASQTNVSTTSSLNSPMLENNSNNLTTGPLHESNLENIDIPVTNIKINSPTNGAIINVDEPISVNGTSEYPENYDCEVMVAAGNSAGVIAPASANHSNFKTTLPFGNNGTKDFREWGLVLEPGTTTLKNGSESITAKLQCYSPLSSVKFAKVNVIANSPIPAELKAMDISIDKSGEGLNQRIIIGANDAETSEPISQTMITGSINDNKFSGSTDTEGKFTTTIPSNVLESGDTINVSVTVTKDAYKLKKTSTSFEGIPVSPSESPPLQPESPPSDRSDNEADLADRIFDDVQKQLNDQGINIPLPFG
jgi:hypothetical protein